MWHHNHPHFQSSKLQYSEGGCPAQCHTQVPRQESQPSTPVGPSFPLFRSLCRKRQVSPRELPVCNISNLQKRKFRGANLMGLKCHLLYVWLTTDTWLAGENYPFRIEWNLGHQWHPTNPNPKPWKFWNILECLSKAPSIFFTHVPASRINWRSGILVRKRYKMKKYKHTLFLNSRVGPQVILKQP